MSTTSLFRSAALFRVAVLCGVLSACGGGGGETAPTAATPPVAGPLAYLLHANKVEVCLIDSADLPVDCADAGVSGFADMHAMAAAGSHAYIADIPRNKTPATLIHCSIGANGALFGCVATGPIGLSFPYGLAVHASTFYIGGVGSPVIRKCEIKADGSLDACSDARFPATLASSVEAIRIVGSTVYILHFATNRVSKCTLVADGSLDFCVDARASGLNGPEGFVINGSHIYFANSGSDNVIRCTIDVDGMLTGCIDAAAEGLSRPTQVEVRGSTFYITNTGSTPGLTRCTVATDGLLTNCTSVFSEPKSLTGIAIK